jgi:hypothetical protein
MGLQWISQSKPTRERSLRPEPPGGMVEATKPFKHSGKRRRQGVRERAGHNMNEHRASFEKGNADADPVDIGGRLASSGIPTIQDRVIQMAAVLILEPIFEADLQPEQYAYRAQRRARRGAGSAPGGSIRECVKSWMPISAATSTRIRILSWSSAWRVASAMV